MIGSKSAKITGRFPLNSFSSVPREIVGTKDRYSDEVVIKLPAGPKTKRMVKLSISIGEIKALAEYLGAP